MIKDTYRFVKESLLTTSTPFDCTQDTQLSGFEIGGTEPANSKRRIVFEVEGKIYRFEGNNLMQIDCDKTVSEVLEKGNTTAELLQVSDIPSWCGKYIYPIIALESPADASVMPSIKLAIKAKSFSDIFQKSRLSPIFDFDAPSKIADITFTKAVTGGGTASLQVRLKENDAWTNFMSVDDALNRSCTAIQLKALQTVTSSSGSSSAQITSAEIIYCKSGEVTSAKSAIYFKAEDFSEDLATCYVLLKHNYLNDNDLKVFVAFDDLPESKEEILGTGTGAAQTFTLEEGIDFDSLEVFVEGNKTFDYSLNAQNKTLTISAGAGQEISVAYKYNLAAENWLECEKQFTELVTNHYSTDSENALTFTSRFVYRLETPEKSKVAKVKIENTAGTSAFEIYTVGIGLSL